MAEERKGEPEAIQGAMPETEHKTEREAMPEAEHRTEQETLSEAGQKTIREEKQEAKSSGGSLFTGIYDQLPDISVKSVDRFILICAIALVAVILVGVLKANHVF